uniref:Uncharacterized protein n=1 Tax=Arundo donax TaxID=35708 RepID=A0A0A8Z8A7_ARUDO
MANVLETFADLFFKPWFQSLLDYSPFVIDNLLNTFC